MNRTTAIGAFAIIAISLAAAPAVFAQNESGQVPQVETPAAKPGDMEGMMGGDMSGMMNMMTQMNEMMSACTKMMQAMTPKAPMEEAPSDNPG